MKKIIILLAVVLSLGMANKASAQVYGSVSFNTFYDELSPYGRWVNDMDYGQVWIADAPGFEPYYNDGHWAYTNYGWTWVSDYSWGWAPFHYGRWAYLPTWGWAWVPGYEWGPAWVSWCQNDGYFGWAPLGPGYGYYRSFNAVPHNYWRFVQQQYITGPELRERIVRPDRNPNLFRNASFINNREVHDNVTYNIGPRRESVERITRQRIDTRPVNFTGADERTVVDQKQVRIYRPEMKPKTQANNNGAVPQPGTAVEQNRFNRDRITRGEAVQQPQANNNLPNNTAVPPVNTQRDRDQRPVRSLPKDRIYDDDTKFDRQQDDDRRRVQLPRQQATQNNDGRPVQNNQPDVIRQQQAAAQEAQRRQQQQEQQQAQLQQQELQRRRQMQSQQEDQRRQQQAQADQQRRAQQQQQQDEQRRQQQAQLEQQRREQQQQSNEQRRQQQDEQRRQQQAQVEQQRREQQQQRDNDLRQQQRDEQRQQQLEQRRQQNEQRQNELRQQRTQQQQDNWQRQTEQRPQRSFERPAPIKNFPKGNL